MNSKFFGFRRFLPSSLFQILRRVFHGLPPFLDGQLAELVAQAVVQILDSHFFGPGSVEKRASRDF